MFSDDRNIENLGQLYAQIKRYLALQKEYARLEVVEKLALLFSTLLLVFIGVALGLVALFYLMFALAYVLEPYVGLPASFAILGGCSLLLLLFVYSFRKRLIVTPVVRFLAILFMDDRNRKTEE